jgi:predicted transcriptional regulator
MSEPRKQRGRPNIVGIEKGIGPLEAQVMRAIADLAPPVTVREVCDALSRQGYFAYQGVLNCMNRLVRKGILERTKRGGAFAYTPLVEQEALAAEAVTNVLGHMGGTLDRVICRVLNIDPDIGEEELAELREKVRAIAREKRKR